MSIDRVQILLAYVMFKSPTSPTEINSGQTVRESTKKKKRRRKSFKNGYELDEFKTNVRVAGPF